MRPCESDWMRPSAKRSPEARWRPAATGPLMVWKVSSVSMQSWLRRSTSSSRRMATKPISRSSRNSSMSDAVGEDTGAKPVRAAGIEVPFEDQVDLLRPAEIEFLADHLLEEQS